MQQDDRQQHVVVVTGASRGLGLGLVCLLASQKVPVLLTARNQEALDRVVRTVKTDSPLVAMVADAADDTAMGSAFARAQTLGTVSGVVLNAGVLEPIGPVDQVDLSAFESALRTNVLGPLIGMRQALRCRSDQEPLRIVVVSSGASQRAYAGWGAYCSSKAALTMLSQVVALECAAHKRVSVVALAPGIVETAMQRTLRATPARLFPEQLKFVELKQRGLLRHPVEAALALDWLARQAPLDLSGQFLDATADQVRAAADRHRAQLESKYAQALEWFSELEKDS